MAARTDSAILHEIVRVIRERAQVPEKVRIRTKQYQITYLEDHRQRLEEAMRRHDNDRLSMLFGQLPGRIKYQLMKPSRRAKPAAKPAAKPSAKPSSKRKPLARGKAAPTKSLARGKAAPTKSKAKTVPRPAVKRRARA